MCRYIRRLFFELNFILFEMVEYHGCILIKKLGWSSHHDSKSRIYFVSVYKSINIHVYKRVGRSRIHNKALLTFIGMEEKIWIPLLGIH